MKTIKYSWLSLIILLAVVSCSDDDEVDGFDFYEHHFYETISTSLSSESTSLHVIVESRDRCEADQKASYQINNGTDGMIQLNFEVSSGTASESYNPPTKFLEWRGDTLYVWYSDISYGEVPDQPWLKGVSQSSTSPPCSYVDIEHISIYKPENRDVIFTHRVKEIVK